MPNTSPIQETTQETRLERNVAALLPYFLSGVVMLILLSWLVYSVVRDLLSCIPSGYAHITKRSRGDTHENK